MGHVFMSVFANLLRADSSRCISLWETALGLASVTSGVMREVIPGDPVDARVRDQEGRERGGTEVQPDWHSKPENMENTVAEFHQAGGNWPEFGLRLAGENLCKHTIFQWVTLHPGFGKALALKACVHREVAAYVEQFYEVNSQSNPVRGSEPIRYFDGGEWADPGAGSADQPTTHNGRPANATTACDRAATAESSSSAGGSTARSGRPGRSTTTGDNRSANNATTHDTGMA